MPLCTSLFSTLRALPELALLLRGCVPLTRTSWNQSCAPQPPVFCSARRSSCDQPPHGLADDGTSGCQGASAFSSLLFSLRLGGSLLPGVLLPEHSSKEFMHLRSLQSAAPILRSCRKLWGFLPAQDGIGSGTSLSRTGVHSALSPGSQHRPWCHARRHIGGIAIAEALQISQQFYIKLRFLAQDGQELGCHSKVPQRS